MDMSVLKIEDPPTDNDKEVVDRFEKVKIFLNLGRKEVEEKRVLQGRCY